MKKNTIVGGAGLVLVLLSGCNGEDGLVNGPSTSDHNNSVVPQVVAPAPSAEGLPSVGLPPVPPYTSPPLGGPVLPAVPGQWGGGKQIGYGKPPLPLPLPLPVPPPLPLPLPVPPPLPFPGIPKGPGPVPPFLGGPTIPLSDDIKVINGRYNLVSARCSNRRSFPVSLDVSYTFNNATSGLVQVEDGPRNLRQIPLKLNYNDTDQIKVEPNVSSTDLQDQKLVNRFAFRGTPDLSGNSLRIRGEFSPELYNCGTDDSPEPAVEVELHSVGERDSE